MLFAVLKKVLKNFTTKIGNVNSVKHNEVWNVTMRIKVKYQIKETYNMKKIETCYLQSRN